MTQTTTQPAAPTTALPPADEVVASTPTGRPAQGGSHGERPAGDHAARAPRGTAAGTGPRPTPLVVPGVPAAVSAAELAAIAGSTAAYAGGVPGLLAAGAIAGTTAAVATVRRARARRTARRTGVVGTRVGGRGSRRAGGTGRQGGLMSRARAAMGARRQRSARAAAAGARRTPPGARAAAAHAQRAGRGNKPVTRTVPPGSRATTGTGRGTTRRGPLSQLLGQSRSAGDRRAAGRGNRGLFGRNRTSGSAGSREVGSRGRRRASGAAGSRSATGGNGVGGHGARRTSNPIRPAWREAASHRKALRDNARQAHRDAERARSRHRMVRQIIADAPTPRHARSATYRIVYSPARRAGERPVPLAPLRAVSAAGWATGAWVAASGYAAWSRHWQAQQQLALGVATGNRGYVVSERVRTAPVPKPDSGSIFAPPPAARPVIVRPPTWQSGDAGSTTSGGTTPTSVGSSIPTSGGISVSRFNISDLAMEQAARAARYTPDTMAYFGADLAQWPEAIGHLALALSTFVKKGTAEFPVHPQVMEKLAEVYKALGTAAAAANEVPALFTRAHSIDLARHQAPRRGEHLWNVNP